MLRMEMKMFISTAFIVVVSLFLTVEPCIAEKVESSGDEPVCSSSAASQDCPASTAKLSQSKTCSDSLNPGREDCNNNADHVEGEDPVKHTEGEEAPSDKYKDILRRSIESFERMLDSMEESRHQVLKKLEDVVDQMAVSRDKVLDKLMKKLDSVYDTVSHSKVMQELDHLLEEVAHSKVIEEIKALPRELTQSLVSVRNRSYVYAGIMCAVTTAVLVAGSLYYNWCHHEASNYKTLAYDMKALQGDHAFIAALAKHAGDGGKILPEKQMEGKSSGNPGKLDKATADHTINSQVVNGGASHVANGTGEGLGSVKEENTDKREEETGTASETIESGVDYDKCTTGVTEGQGETESKVEGGIRMRSVGADSSPKQCVTNGGHDVASL